MRMFAERLLTTRIPAVVPEPDHYDEAFGISVTVDGEPFVESPPVTALATVTKAAGESHDALTGAITRTFSDGEGVDEYSEPPPIPLPPQPPRSDGRPWSVTITRAEGEKPDRGDGAAMSEKAADQIPPHVSGLWAITKTSAPGEKPDR
jgi:hypothetical protein